MPDIKVPDTDDYPWRVKNFEDGNCWFFGYYRDTPCMNTRVDGELYCSRHLGVKCEHCGIQATHEEGESGSLNYFYPYCNNHHYRS